MEIENSNSTATAAELDSRADTERVDHLSEVTFDDQDENLFLVNDARLRADALQHSILPRLRVVLNEACALIHRVYGIDVFEDSIVSYYPHFRRQRDQELKLLYHAALVGLNGQRAKGKWHGLTRQDNKPVQIVPFRLAFALTPRGFGFILENWSMKLSAESFRRVLSFLIGHIDLIQLLCMKTGMVPQITSGGEVRHLAPLREQYRRMIDGRSFGAHFFVAPRRAYPIGRNELSAFIRAYALFFPVYDSFIQIAKGEPVRFGRLISQANNWLDADGGKDSKPVATKDAAPNAVVDLEQAAEAAEQRVPVMPAMRWRVFQRDHWKCVACGRGSHDGIILHVDHILPRSKGGRDCFENFQTLCNVCNGGKSNRDATDLRNELRSGTPSASR